MISRPRFLTIYLILTTALSILLFIGLKIHQSRSFSSDKIDYLLNTVSPLRDKTDDLCKYYMRGDPDAGSNYLKINFYCYGDRNSKNTLDLAAIEDQTLNGVLSEYARIIGFDPDLIHKNNWYCLYDSREITPQMFTSKVKPPGSIDCYQSKELRHD